MRLKAFKITQKGYSFSFENELGLPISIQCSALTKDLERLLTMIKAQFETLFPSNSVEFIGYQIKEKPDQLVCIYEFKTYINNVRAFCKTNELFFGIYDDEVLETLSSQDKANAENFSRLSDLIQNHFEIQAINDISQLMSASEQLNLFN